MNPFQAQFPLSRKKFWKKFLPVIIPSLVVSVVIGLVSIIALFMINDWLPDSAALVMVQGLLLSIGLWILLLALYTWYFRVYIRTYSYEGGENFITIKKGVFAPREIHVQYQKIQDVYVDQDILDRILGIYDVHISSATVSSGVEAHIDGVDPHVAEGLKLFFLEKIQRAAPGYTSGEVLPGAVGQASVAPIQLSEEISSTAYPLRPKWMVKSILGSIFTSIIIGLLAGGYVSAKASSGGTGMSFMPTFVVVTIGYFVIHVIGLFLWKSNYRFQFLPDYIQYNTGILSRSEQHLPYRTVQDVSIAQSLIDRMFGLANVVIENAAQVSMGKYGSKNASIKLVGMTRAEAAHITETLKPIILTKTQSATGL